MLLIATSLPGESGVRDVKDDLEVENKLHCPDLIIMLTNFTG